MHFRKEHTNTPVFLDIEIIKERLFAQGVLKIYSTADYEKVYHRIKNELEQKINKDLA